MKKAMGWMVLATGGSVLGALLGCGGPVITGWDTTRSALVEGLPAEVVATQAPEGVTLRLDADHAGVVRGATIRTDAAIETLAPGVLDGRAITLAIESCEGPALADPICVSTVDAELEITDLADGVRRVDYRATRVAADGTRAPVSGSFLLDVAISSSI